MIAIPENIDPSVIAGITALQARHYGIIPYKISGGTLFFYAVDENMNDEIALLLDRPVALHRTEPALIEQLLDRYYQKAGDARQQLAYYNGEAEHFLSHLINEARNLNSSDVHIETYEEVCRVRIRIDGALLQRYLLDKKQYPALVNKIKIFANLDIAEKRLPQDGRIFFETGNYKIDIRVSVLPTLYGEKVVLRLLNNDASNIDLQQVGFAEDDLHNFLEGIRKPNGILLISGPTGSGKTTTLYATLKQLNKASRNILTIEDPIEYTLEGINQVQLRENIGLSFAAALKTFLRQDPDIIMLGEIRDADTAGMAIRAALTGHLVLSTIHTNSAWGIVSRLVDMGIEPFLLAQTLNTAVAQRLIRLLCTACKKKVELDASLYPRRFKPYKTLAHHYVAGGCQTCYNTGYKGRKAVYEVIPVDEDLADMIKQSNFKIQEQLRSKKIRSLSENAFKLFETGQTSLEEVYPLLVNS